MWDALFGQYKSPLSINLLAVQHLMHNFTLRCITRSEMECEKRLTVKCDVRQARIGYLMKTESGRLDFVISDSLSYMKKKTNRRIIKRNEKVMNTHKNE